MMMQIKEFAKFCGVSIRTLHYYDKIGLLIPPYIDNFNGYRYYDEDSIKRMQEILFYKELDFSLSSIKEILSSKNYDKNEALKKQKELLIIKKQKLEKIIDAIDKIGNEEIDMSIFKNDDYEAKRKEYEKEAKEKWGKTSAYKEYEDKNLSKEDLKEGALLLEEVFEKFSQCAKNSIAPSENIPQALVKLLKDTISKNFYTCTDEILAGLSEMYVLDERFKNNLDKYGKGTAQYISDAIKIYCEK